MTFRPARWDAVAPAIVRDLLSLDPLLANNWVQALQPARMHLRKPLLDSFSERPAQEVRLLLAAGILAEYGESEHTFMPDHLLADLVLKATRPQYSALLPLVRKRVPALVGRMTAALSERIPMNASEEDSPRLEQRIEGQANAAETLLIADHPEEFWPRLRQSDDPRLRTRLIDRLTVPGLSIENLMDRFNDEAEGSIRQAILIGLGSGFTNLSASERDTNAKRLLALYESDPDPGVHGAAEWVLRKWGFEQQVPDGHRGARRKTPGHPALVRHLEAAHDDRDSRPRPVLGRLSRRRARARRERASPRRRHRLLVSR